jgi:tocopherol O-methyltransferase
MRPHRTLRPMETTVSLFSSIRSYYDRTWFDYRTMWLDHENLAFHFGYYDEGVNTHQEALVNTNATLARLARIQPGDHVLDAGCGLGGSAFWLAQERGATVLGVNIVPRQIARAKEIAQEKGLADKVQFHGADYCHTGQPDASFDVVWALESLCHCEDKQAFYREAFRVLKPGGRLIIAEYMLQGAPDTPRDARLLKEWLEGWTMPNLYQGTQHEAAATAAGFGEVGVIDHTQTVRPSLARLFRRACVAALPNEAFYRLGLRCGFQRGNVVASLRQYQALSRRLWFYGLLHAVKR